MPEGVEEKIHNQMKKSCIPMAFSAKCDNI